MRINRDVQGTMTEVSAHESNGNRVYIRGNIKQMTDDDRTYWQYDEIVLESAEYDALSIGAWSGTWTDPLRSVERRILHADTTDDTMQAFRKLREGDKTIDWQAWLDTLDAYNVAIEETKDQKGYPLKVVYPEYPKRSSEVKK